MAQYTMFQFFHWFYSRQSPLWEDVRREAPQLADLGVGSVWLPPAFKGAAGAETIGYDIYDLYDLGEFDQKGSVETRYGSRQMYQQAIGALHDHGMQVYQDVVLNHKAGADGAEEVRAVRVNPENRTEVMGDPYAIEAFTRFDFPGRGGRYSAFKWDFHCFSGVDWDERAHEQGVYKIINEYGDQWAELLSEEKGNFDYLMFADIEFRNPHVVEELKRWGCWLVRQTDIDGFRLDAVKHITPDFFPGWLASLREASGKELFSVGEYAGTLELMQAYLERTGYCMSLFDFPLHEHFVQASRRRSRYDLRKLLSDTLVAADPQHCVTFVDNHDTQAHREFSSDVKPWFKAHAYAVILLREAGYPCVFYPDLYGADFRVGAGEEKHISVHYKACPQLESLMRVRKDLAYGPQQDYFVSPGLVGWVRRGEPDGPSGCAVVMTHGEEASLEMEMGEAHANRTFREATGSRGDSVRTDDRGRAAFPVNRRSVAVWVREG